MAELNQSDITQLKPIDLLTRWRQSKTRSRSKLELNHVQQIKSQALAGDHRTLEIYVKYLQQRVVPNNLNYWQPIILNFLENIDEPFANPKYAYWLAQLNLLVKRYPEAIALLAPHSEAKHIPSLCALSAVLTQTDIMRASEAANLAHLAQTITSTPCAEAIDDMQVLLRLALAIEYPLDLPLSVKELSLLDEYARYQNDPQPYHQLQFAIALYKQDMFAQALPVLQLLADKGNAEAAYYLGNIYHYGLAHVLDIPMAEHYYQIGIDHKHPRSYYEMAQMYGEFSHLPQDLKLRNGYYKAALLMGVSEAAKPVIYDVCHGKEYHDHGCQHLVRIINSTNKNEGFDAVISYYFSSLGIQGNPNMYQRQLRRAVELGNPRGKLYAMLKQMEERHVVINQNNLAAVAKYIQGFSQEWWFLKLCNWDPMCFY
ncbi:MAG: sel1 repeat family protein [Shewanellaceae bacterium]|nr:sel1 repeat family protein [Shewanellaceae bacterium]